MSAQPYYVDGEDALYVKWRKFDNNTTLQFYALCLLSVGVLPLICFHCPSYRYALQSIPSNPDEADFVQIFDERDANNKTVKVAHLSKHIFIRDDSKTQETVLVFEYDCARHCAADVDGFQVTRVPDVPEHFLRYCHFADREKVLSSKEKEILTIQYGLNVMEIPQSSLLEIALTQILSPFYIFQYFASIVWYIEDYALYASLIVLITIAAIVLTVRETVFNLQALRELAGSQQRVKIVDAVNSDGTVANVYEDHDSALIVGDRVVIEEQMIIPCDCVLLTGKVIVDESMLTGESVPVNKTAFDAANLDSDSSTSSRMSSCSLVASKERNSTVNNTSNSNNSNKNNSSNTSSVAGNLAQNKSGNILFAGTKVKAVYPTAADRRVQAVCYRTGFRSAKGQLVSLLLAPKDKFMSFVYDAIVVLLIMILFMHLIFIGIAVELARVGYAYNLIFLTYLDALTIAVPPALTACLTVSTAISIDRLKAKDIYVTDTLRVNVAGLVNSVSFDKTGTLTENALHLMGMLVVASLAQTLPTDTTEGELGAERGEQLVDIAGDRTEPGKSGYPAICRELMATCHSLILLDEPAGTGQSRPIDGDPLEVELFQASQWTLQPASQSGLIVATPPAGAGRLTATVLKHFEFTPDRLRAASIVREESGGDGRRLKYLVKGSPEVIVQLCRLPDTQEKLHREVLFAMSELGKRGFRLIAMAMSEITSEEVSTSTGKSTASVEESVLAMTQEEIERQFPLHFLGLLYLSSNLKSDTVRTIDELIYDGQVNVNMITGDHVTTAITIAKQCHLLHSSAEVVEDSVGNGRPAPADHRPSESSLKATLRAHNEHQSPRELHKVFIIDGDDSAGPAGDGQIFPQVKILDHDTDKLVAQSDLSLHELLRLTMLSTVRDNFFRGNNQNFNQNFNQTNPTNSISAQRRERKTRQSVNDRDLSDDENFHHENSNFKSNFNDRVKETELQTMNPILADRRTAPAGPTGLYRKYLDRIVTQEISVEIAITGKGLRALLHALLVPSGSPTEELLASTPASTTLGTTTTNTSSAALETSAIENIGQLIGSNRTINPSHTLLFCQLIRYCKVFARMKPHDKRFVVELLQQITEFEALASQQQLQLQQTTNTNDDIYLPERKTRFSLKNVLFEDVDDAQPVQGSGCLSWISRSSDSERIRPLSVLFCGDGANDMIALRSSNVGVSLCDSETSVAAPITSKLATPYAVVQVLREGRCSLVTAYVLIMFNIMYATIQLFMACAIYSYSLQVGTYMYLVQDLFYTLELGIFISYTAPAESLSAQLPTPRFLTVYFMLRLTSMLLLFIAFQVFALAALSMQDFYSKYDLGDKDPLSDSYAYETAVINDVVLGQLMIAAAVASMNKPFRVHWTQNKYLVLSLLLQLAWLLFQVFGGDNYLLVDILQTKPFPAYFGALLMLILLFNAVSALAITMVIDRFFVERAENRWFQQPSVRQDFRRLLRESKQ